MRTNADGSGSVMAQVRRRGVGELTRDVVHRFREADGTSHMRALGYQGIFALISGYIGLIGLASVLGVAEIRTTVMEISKRIAPGPSGQLLQEAARQASGGTAMIFGLAAALIAGTFAMAQIERSGNRIAGRSEDRPTGRRYAVAFGLALSAGLLSALGLMVLAGGDALTTGFGWRGATADIWNVLRWPIGIALAAGGIYLLMRAAPERPLGSRETVMAGAIVAVALWVLFTIALAVYFSMSNGSQTYGQLLSVLALLLWAGATSLALHLGMAVSVELAAGDGEVQVFADDRYRDEAAAGLPDGVPSTG